jgi:hypothetical protein
MAVRNRASHAPRDVVAPDSCACDCMCVCLVRIKKLSVSLVARTLVPGAKPQACGSVLRVFRRVVRRPLVVMNMMMSRLRRVAQLSWLITWLRRISRLLRRIAGLLGRIAAGRISGLHSWAGRQLLLRLGLIG